MATMNLDLSAIRTVLLDMDGVLYRGQQVLPGVHELLAFLDQRDIPYACTTNNATRTQAQYGTKLRGMDIHIPEERVLTSALVTGYYLRQHYPQGTTIYALGMEGLIDALFHDSYFISVEEPTDKPELVVQGAHFAFSYDHLKRACLAIRGGARFIATNPDKTFPSEEGLIPGAGAIAAALQAATDVEPLMIGKPQPTIFEVAIELLGGRPETTLMIGDRLDTDIAGAHNASLHSALVLTGVTQREDIADSPYQPDAVFNDLPALLAAWRDA